jgi:hypothetical protein
MAAKKKIKKPAAKSKPKPATKKKKKVALKVGPQATRAAVRPTLVSAVTYPSNDTTRFWKRERYNTLREFWPFYLHEHRYAVNRTLHFVGSTLGLAIFVTAIGTGKLWLILPAFVSGYAFAWVGHFFIEKNRPATFTYPLKSFISDWRLWYVTLTGRARSELKKFGIESK